MDMLKDEVVTYLNEKIRDEVETHYGMLGYNQGGPDENAVLERIFGNATVDFDDFESATFYASYVFHKICLEQMAAVDRGLVKKTYKSLTANNIDDIKNSYLYKEPDDVSKEEAEEIYW